MAAATVEAPPRAEEIYANAIAELLVGARSVAVGMLSPIPGAGALLARELSAGADGGAGAGAGARVSAGGEASDASNASVESSHSTQGGASVNPMRVTILGSREHNRFTNGGAELFDQAGRGRIDAFFLSGGQIDGQANINLVGTGEYPATDVRWSGSFGSGYLYFVVPRVILFRWEHSRRTLVRQVDFISAPGTSAPGVHRPGGPIALITNLCLFKFERARGRFALHSLHPGHTLEEVRDQTGFDFDIPAAVPATPLPRAARLALLRGPVARQIAGVYPGFAQQVFGATAGV